MNHQDAWEQILKTLQPDLSEEVFELWFKPIKPRNLENHLFHIEVPNKFFSDWIRENYQKKIEDILKALTGQETSLHCTQVQNLDQILQKEIPPIPSREPLQTRSEPALYDFNLRYTFEAFVVGPTNRFAQAAAEAVAKNPGKQFNPLFIYGGVGLGKTHLLHAIGHALKREHPGARALYITSEQFINEYINAIKRGDPDAFRNRYRSLDCLLIDDIQFLMGKERSEEEFFFTFNSLFDSHKQITITSDRTPKDMTPMEERLTSRLEWGVVAPIQPPDLETRIAILRKKAEEERLYVPDDVLLYIASHIRTNIRALEGALIRIAACSSLTGNPLSVDIAKEMLKDMIPAGGPIKPITIAVVQQVVARKFNLETKDLKSKRRTDSIAFPRQVAMYVSRVLTEHSTTEIGEAFGGKDHSTVMHACEKIKNKLGSDGYFAALVNQITQEIKDLDNP